jgi:glycerophosphoryl diester phosphodiesterase
MGHGAGYVMMIARTSVFLTFLFLCGCVVTVNERVLVGKDRVTSWNSKLVIAHRGASGYLPEHTIAAKAMAYGQGADYIEQDLVMTKDDEIVVLHDHYLDTVTNVSDVFPSRARKDGRFYVIDFTLAEIRQLAVYERFAKDGSMKTPVFKGRFPLEKSTFRVNTFAEEIELVQGLNKSTGRTVGIYPEIKSPAFHREEGKDISAAVIRILKDYGYRTKQDPVFLQCFDSYELQRIHQQLLPEMGMAVPLVQLLGTNPQFKPALTEEGLERVAAYADGIGPSLYLVVKQGSSVEATDLVDRAHELGLVVHPYTFRADELPEFADDYQQLLRIYLKDVGVDGLFTDFPDLTKEYIASNP